MKKFKNIKRIKRNDCTSISSNFAKNSTLCTLSGGQDSMLTFFVLLHTQPKDFFYILYCQHFWQLKNFFSARFVFKLSYLVNVSYILILPQNNGLNENESRSWRKKNFYRVSQAENILISLTGHTQTDTLEKNLHNLLRGTSPASFSDSNLVILQNRTEVFFSNINLNSCFFYKLKKFRNSVNPKFDEFRTQFLFENIKRKKVFFEKSKKIVSPVLSKNILRQNSRFINKNYVFCSKLSQVPERKKFQSFNRKKPFFNKLYFVSVNSLEQKKCVQVPITTKALFLSKEICTLFLNKTFLNSKNFKNSCFEGDSRKSYSFCISTKFWNRNVNLLKPLQHLNRFKVSKILQRYKLPNLIDITNFSSAFSRNKIRHQFIPFIRFLLHQKVDSLLINFFRMLEEDSREREKQIQELYFLCKLVKSKSPKNSICSTQMIPILKNLGLNSFFVRIEAKKRIFLAPIDSDFLVFDSGKLSLLYPKSRIKMNFTPFLKQKFVQPNHFQLIKSISQTLSKSVNQKLFLDYKNLSLTYSQTLKLQQFF